MSTINLETAKQFIDLIRLPDALHELRILSSKGTFGGYYDDSSLLARDAIAQSGTGNVYVTLNPANPDCRSRALHRIVWAGKGASTKDHEIANRATMLVDFDPVRLSGIPSTDAEHGAALDLAKVVKEHLESMGWPAPILTDSGNGAALLYRIDLPTDDGGLVRRVLDELAKRFNTSAVKIDTSVHNASRITRVPGTLNFKGENLPDRPHRIARLVEAPATFMTVTCEQLEQLAATRSEETGSAYRAGTASMFDVPTWLTQRGMGFTAKSGQCHDLKGTWFTLAYCPFKGPQHADGNTAIFAGNDGRIFAKCHHEKCKDKNWRTLRQKIDPEFDTRSIKAVLGGSDEAINDSHRLARAVLEHFDHPEHRTLILSKGSIYKWDGVWTLCADDAIKLLIWRVVKEEFDSFARKMAAQGVPTQVPSVNTDLVRNVFGALRSMIEVNANVGDWLAGDGPPVRDLLICKNGILNLPAFVANRPDSNLAHTPRLFVLNKLDFDFNATAPTPTRWLQFLDEVWPDDLDSRLLLQQFFGYALTQDVSKQKFLMLLGATRGGKGVITRLLTALVGRDNACSIRLGRLGERFSLAAALGKSLILIPDANMPQNYKACETVEALKALTGGDELDIDRKNLPVVSMALPAKVVMASNQMIDLPDHSRALNERMVVLLFSNSFAKNPDTQLDEKLRLELPGILLWAIQGWKSLQECEKFIEPEASRGLKTALQESASPIQGFIAECCIINSRARADKDELYEIWKMWCQSRELEAGKKSAFGKLLFEAQPQIKNSRPIIEGKRVWLYAGIGLRESDSTHESANDAETAVEPAVT